jgi:hypothetical protein
MAHSLAVENSAGTLGRRIDMVLLICSWLLLFDAIDQRFLLFTYLKHTGFEQPSLEL